MRRVVFLICIAAAAEGLAEETPVEAQVDGYLGAIERPVPPSTWKSLGPEGRAVLRRRLDDATILASMRARAADALAHVGTEDDAERLATLAGEEGAPVMLRDRSLHAAGRLLPAGRFVPMAQKLMEHAGERRMRAAAAKALAELGGAAGCEKLRVGAGKVKGEDQALFTGALKRCAGRGGR